jgi:diguanylate cyclase (GGDEF)-like protein/PAS domain S-box-containing protein
LAAAPHFRPPPDIRDRAGSVATARLGSPGHTDAELGHSGRFESLADVLTSGIVTADGRGEVVYANPAARELFWRTDERLFGDAWLEAVDSRDRGAVASAAERVIAESSTEIYDFRINVFDQVRWVRARFNAIRAGIAAPTGWVAILDDVTVERANAEALAERATHDQLTGLPNRALLEDRLAQALARSERHHTPVAVLFVDLDRFKPVNDRYGHQVGDQILREIGRRIGRTMRADDTSARLGGDEFVVVAEGLDRDQAAAIAERIVEAVSEPVVIDGARVSVGASVGIAWSATGSAEPAELIAAADHAMYEAKRSGSGAAFAPHP